MITGEEFARRMRRISQMRNYILTLKRAALKAYERGEIPFRPKIDVRCDVEHWKRLLEERENARQ